MKPDLDEMLSKIGGSGYLAGQILVAMPNMGDPRFERSVIFLCVHNSEGAMGLILNRINTAMDFGELMQQLNIETSTDTRSIPVHFGGPVEMGRGFVLHSADYIQDGSLMVGEDFALTATVDILKALAQGQGPKQAILALGYAGWGPGQLDAEMQQNGWLNVPADANLVFSSNMEAKWHQAIAKLGIEQAQLSGEAGRA
ncbi:MAG: YqgE/AlgH family protein [Dongiaceae bacterium]